MNIVRYYPRAYRGDGGITNSVRRLSEACVRAGANVSVAVDERDVPAERERTTPFRWVSVRHVGPPSLRRPVGLDASLRRADLLVLHSAWTYQNVVAARCARRIGLPYLLEPRGAYDPLIFERRRTIKRLWWWAFERRLVRESAAIHTFFVSQRDHLRRIGYHGPTVVAPNGVTPPEGFEWDGGSGNYVLWVGRFDPEHKGLDLLLQGLKQMPPDDRPHIRLHGPDWAGGKARVIALVDRMDLAADVTIGPAVHGADKWRLLSRATAFTYPSRWEGFGNSAAEAVSIGVPTLVTPYPFGQWLGDHDAAIVAEPTPAGLAEGLARVCAPEAARAAQRGQEIVRRELNWDAVARSWLEQTKAMLAAR